MGLNVWKNKFDENYSRLVIRNPFLMFLSLQQFHWQSESNISIFFSTILSDNLFIY